MDLVTAPVNKNQRRTEPATSSAEWLDLLADQGCDEEAFLQGVAEPLKRSPDAGWELLALLDQYYRRNKISSEVFTAVKTRLQDLLMGNERLAQISSPVPQQGIEHTVAFAPEQPLPPDRPLAPDRPMTLEVSLPTMGAPPMGQPPMGQPPMGQPTAGRAPPTTLRSASIPIPAPPPSGVQNSPPRSLAVGDVLRGRYIVKAVLGQGGMGTVFAASDQYRLDQANGEQTVALKVLHTAVIQRPRLFAELRREFQHLQSLSHPNIVRVHEFDRDGDLAFFTMEYLSGVLLTRLLTAHAKDPLERPAAWSIVRDVGAAVVHAHSRGVVHGDLNPGNIFITDNGEIRVLDFGAAYPLRRTPWISDFESSQQINVATPSYASCQLLEGETADPRDDVYAMACVTYILLTGRHPFGDRSALQARTQHLNPERPAGITRRQWQALRAGLRAERERRPSDMDAWLKQINSSSAAVHLPPLSTLLATGPVRRSRSKWLAAAVFAALVGTGVAWMEVDGDAVSQMQDTLDARLKEGFAGTVLGQAWRGDHESAAEPVPAPPASPTVETGTAPRISAEQATPAPAHAPVATPSAAPQAPVRAVTAAAPSPIKARIELAADSVDVPQDEPVAYVSVRRSRSLRGEASFSWWTESGTAKPARDFTAVKSHVETIPEGKNSADLAIPILHDPGRREPRSFYVVIDEPGDNASLGQRTLTMVTIP